MENRGNFPSSPMSYCEVMCRICHEGDSKEDLFSFCKCAGTLAKAHRSCLEKWLSTANSSACEICKFDFETSRKPRPLLDWFRHSDSSQDANNFIGDLVCFLVLTPLTIISTYLCILGSSHYLQKLGYGWEASGLIVLSIILVTVYFIWLGATMRHHMKTMLKWRENNQSIELMAIREVHLNMELNNNTSSTNNLVHVL